MELFEEKFEINGLNLMVVDSPDKDSCIGCYFGKDFACQGKLACKINEREDNKSVIFQEVKQ